MPLSPYTTRVDPPSGSIVDFEDSFRSYRVHFNEEYFEEHETEEVLQDREALLVH